MSERTSNETAAPVGPSGDVPSLLARAQEWLGCVEMVTFGGARICDGHDYVVGGGWPCEEATRLTVLLTETRQQALDDAARWLAEAVEE